MIRINTFRLHHPNAFVVLVAVAGILAMLCVALLTQGCQPAAPGTPQAGTGALPPESFEVVRVDLGGAANAQVVTELRVIGERVVVGLDASADASGAVCARVSFRWGLLHASTDYPAKCSAPAPAGANPILDTIGPLLDPPAP